MAHFYFALTNSEAISLLKEEVRLRYPNLRLSFSQGEFLTFKSDSSILFSPYFCRVSGVCLGQFKTSQLQFEKAWFYVIGQNLKLPENFKLMNQNSLFKFNEMVHLVMMSGEDEYWVGQYPLKKSHFQTPGEVSSISLRDDVASRAYFKIAEIYEAFDLPMENQDVVLELGCAPGGASQFLLELDLKVLGVDPAQMDPKVLKMYGMKHLKKAFENLAPEDLKGQIDWIICDINLPPTVVLKEIFRILSFTTPRGVLVNLKINDPKHLEVVASVRQKFRVLGFDQVELKYLPSHRSEISLCALKNF
jgi:23S rRNA C2498 (ribose-2'-O)-methylase RlmM